MKWETDVTNNNQEVLTMKYKLKPIQPMPNVLAMTKLLGKPRRMRDSDKDGVIDMLDCEPYNPKKQGILHDVGKWAARKVGVRKAERWTGEYVQSPALTVDIITRKHMLQSINLMLSFIVLSRWYSSH